MATVTRAPRSPAAQLPALYHPWVEALLGGAIPAEIDATCSNCAMLPDQGDPPETNAAGTPTASLFFDPRVKCCTYVPALPNFLVGRILLDRDPQLAEGRASVLARIAAGVGVTPMGLAQPPTFAVLYKAGGAKTFGRSLELRCPHYQTATGACGIWRHRQSVCTTWFCKHVRGAVGERFWQGLRHLLSLVEHSLAVHCVRTLAPGPEAARHAASSRIHPLSNLQASDLDDTPAPSQNRLWGRYQGRERAWFEDTGRIIDAMTWEDVRRTGGVELELAADLLRTAYDDLRSTRLPRVLRGGTTLRSPVGADLVELTAYSGYHPVIAPKALVDVLHVFDGRPTTQAIAAAARAGVAIEPAVVRRLVDIGVLVDGDTAQ